MSCQCWETIGECECSKVPQALFESSGSLRHGCKAGWLTTALKETHLKKEKLPVSVGRWCHTFGASIFEGAAITRSYTIAYKLRVASKYTHNCSCAKFHVPCFAACKCKGNDMKCGRVMPARSLVEDNGYDKNGTDVSEQCLRCDRVTP